MSWIRVAKTMFYKRLQRFLGFAQHARKCENDDFRPFEHTFSAQKCVFRHPEPLSGALQRKEMAPTLKTLFYNAFLKVFELRSAPGKVWNP